MMTDQEAQTLLHDHQLIDPAHVDNETGRWLVDGLTAMDWAEASMHDPHGDALGIAQLLMALDAGTRDDPYQDY